MRTYVIYDYSWADGDNEAIRDADGNVLEARRAYAMVASADDALKGYLSGEVEAVDYTLTPPPHGAIVIPAGSV